MVRANWRQAAHARLVAVCAELHVLNLCSYIKEGANVARPNHVVGLVGIAVLFIAAGTIDWWEAWAYVIQGFLIMVLSRAILIAKNPDQALERAEAGD